MKIFNWVQGKLNNGMVSHQRGISVANEIVDTRVLDSVNLEGLDDILAIGTFGFDQSKTFNSETEEEVADSKSLVVTCQETEAKLESEDGLETEEIADAKLLVVECCQETEAGQQTNMSISKPTIDTFVATANEVCQFDSEMISNQPENDDANKKNKMTLSDLFLADDYFFRNPDKNVGNITADVKKPSDCSDNCEERVKTVHTSTPATASAAVIQTKDRPSCSFIKKLPIPCMTAGKDSSCFLYPRLPTRKLHRMMAKMLKKKKKIHPAAAQNDGENAEDTESKIIKVCH